jgi:4-methyl-5(b-hydroxyethyl)-thiazole monophosphate biosynthesis
MNVLVPLADGVEEMEATIAIDVLRRAGITVVVAAVGAACEITASRGVRLVADDLWRNLDPLAFDALLLPGGAVGTRTLMADARVLAAVRAYVSAGKLVAAVCAAPLVLQAAGVLDGVAATCHPSVAAELTRAVHRTERVVKTAGIITSQCPGTSMEFALAVVERLIGRPAAEKVAAGLLLPPGLAW